ncbi:hypothetical protein Calni_1694 [Calditerrivibrio nitroreducens DSM 19672]|uniref:VCBS repeat-containing protein n=2 Tax=Calditerrivibrio nitroreducens TaxID=477976 RepID=E4TFU4_CALNY|nr:hypothetical protein Calni_1694 [Calditerrivibrio nitroreducens DSM 19672]
MMFKFSRVKLFLLFLLLYSSYSHARFEDLVRSVDQFFNTGKGVIVSVDNDDLIIDLTAETGSYPGKIFKIYKEGVPIKHPITGKILGNRKFYVGSIRVTEVFDKYSTAKIIEKKDSIEPGLTVMVNLPLNANINFLNFDKRLELLMREDLAKSSTIKITKDPSDTILRFTQDEKGGITLDININNKTVKSFYFSDINVANIAKATTTDILKSKPQPYEFRTMAVGNIFKDDYDYIVAAERRYVHYYRFNGKDFEYLGKIDKKFDEIISVEVYDLNNNGIDEIFISTVEDSRYVNTYIYEYDGKNFKILKSNLPFIVRSVFENGEQKIVMQRISRDGAYIGTINYLNPNYERGEAIPNSQGLGIFGFGYAETDGDKIKETFFINQDGKLLVFKNGKQIFESNDYFGETPYDFTLKEEVKSTKPGNTVGNLLSRGQSAEDVTEYLEKRKKLKGRVFVTSDKTIFLVKNNMLSKMLPNLQSYESASIAGYQLRNNILRKTWESDNFDPIISDYYLKERYSKKYMYLLRVDTGGIFKSGTSEIYYIEIK